MERKAGQGSSKKKTESVGKRTSVKRNRKSTLKKPKVKISTYKVILLCTAVIMICMLLLLITSTASKKSEEKEIQNQELITSRFVEEDKSSQNEISKNPVIPEQKKKEPVAVEPKKNEQKKETDTVTEIQIVQKTEKTEKIEKPETTVIAVTQKKDLDLGLPKAVNNAQLVFVFDDGGQNLKHLEKFLKLPFPYTVAVLPKLVHSKETAQKVRASGNEVILHQPMQSINHEINPGPGAITYDMNKEQIHRILQKNIEEIWPIAGLNNHEGSEITADPEKMEEVLRVASTYGIFFLDSRTNVETVVPEVATAMGYHYYERNIFLDNEKTRSNILSELKKGLAIANKNGVVIMIGHIWSADILPAVLQEVYPELKSKGYTFSVVSESKAIK